MKTRTTESKSTTGLPPPPAPPSRDANPWTISTPASSSASSRPPRAMPTAKGGRPHQVPPTVKGGRPNRSPEHVPSPQRASGGQWVPIAVLAFMVMAGLGSAMSALESGNVEAAIGPLLVTAFAVVVLWRRLRRRHELNARDPRDS